MAQSSEFPIDRIPVRRLVRIVPAVLAVILLLSSFFQIDPEEVGVVLRFGKYVRTANPGLHMRVSLPEQHILTPKGGRGEGERCKRPEPCRGNRHYGRSQRGTPGHELTEEDSQPRDRNGR